MKLGMYGSKDVRSMYLSIDAFEIPSLQITILDFLFKIDTIYLRSSRAAMR
jgi:hypothetical protein